MTFPGFEPSAVARALGYLPEAASDFAEGYFERLGEVSFSPGEPNSLSTRAEEGLCVRLRSAGTDFYSSRDALTEDAFVAAYRQVARTLPSTPVILRHDADSWRGPEEPPEELMTAPARLQSRLLQRGVGFRYQASFSLHTRQVLVAASSLAGTAQSERYFSVRLRLPGGPWGTLLTSLGAGVPERLADLAAEFAKYAECEPEILSPRTLVLGPHAAAVFLHEAVAHTLEVDTLAAGGDPRAAIGHQLGSAELTVFDDPGSAPECVRRTFDDEGIPVVRRGLLRDGRIEQPISDRAWSERVDGLIPGGGRRADRSSLPGPRSSHLEVAPGESSPQELVRSTKDGLYLPMLSRGQLDPLKGTCRLDAPGAIEIRDGELGRRIGRCRVEGSAADLLHAVVAVGSDQQVAGAGWCAKSQQKLAVWATTPSLVLDGIGVRPW